MSFAKKTTIVKQEKSCCTENQQSFEDGMISRHTAGSINVAILHYQYATAGLEEMSSRWDNIECICQHNDADACLSYWKAQPLLDWPDVFCVSTKLKSWDMGAVVKALKTHHPALNIIVLHEYDDDNIGYWFDCGAKGYINLRADAFEIKLAIETVANNRYYFLRPIDTLWFIYPTLAALKKALKRD